MKPLKVQFPLYSQFTVNIDDASLGFHIDSIYKFVLRSKLGSVIDDVFALTEDTTNRPELLKLYNDYILPYWIYLTIKRFITTHGIHITQQGVIVMTDPQGTFIPATSQERSWLIQAVDQDLKAAEALLLTELGKINWTIDTVGYRKIGVTACGSDSKVSTGSWGISAIE